MKTTVIYLCKHVMGRKELYKTGNMRMFSRESK